MVMIERKRRVRVVLGIFFVAFILLIQQSFQVTPPPSEDQITKDYSAVQGDSSRALDVLDSLQIRGRAPKTDYEREQFGAGWAEIESCDIRNIILQRDLSDVVLADDGCTVLSGTLEDPYTGKTIAFERGSTTSSAVQIDHVVALSDAWQKGAQQMDVADRAAFANDPLNLLAVDGPVNQKKADHDAASWLPPNKSYRCRFVARQIAVKQTYGLWVTQAEYDAMRRELERCPEQILPLQLLPDLSDDPNET